jgi:hypothetical protein
MEGMIHEEPETWVHWLVLTIVEHMIQAKVDPLLGFGVVHFADVQEMAVLKMRCTCVLLLDELRGNVDMGLTL